MLDFKLKLMLTVLSSLLFSLIFIMLALVLPAGPSYQAVEKENLPQTQFQKMSKGMKDGFNK